MSLISLTTTGARTGREHRVTLGTLDIDGRLVVVASAMGSPKHPAWYHNIRHNPLVTVETGTETYAAMAAVAPDRDRLFARIAEREPGFADYQARTTRVLPVLVLHRLDRVRRMGDWLVEVHDWLRAELRELRAQLDSGDAPRFGKRCLGFCSALTRHHSGETAGVFPMLAAQFPALAPALTKLGEEHVVVARLQDEIERLLGEETEPARLGAELDRLAAELDGHFAYEEKVIVTALNALAPAPDAG
jgi:deazaflavin-dependent oxidoreductase (nitroreductase family)